MSENKIPDVCVLRESEPFEYGGRAIGGVKFSREFKKRTHGLPIPIKANGVEVAVGVAEFRRDGLYLTNIMPTSAGAEWAKQPKGSPTPMLVALPERIS